MLSVYGLTKIYEGRAGRTLALHDAHFELGAGELVALTGPSGSGKTTLLAILGCLMQPTSGIYIVEGRDVLSLTRPQLETFRRQTIGFVFQDHRLIPHLSLIENVALPLFYRGVGRRQRRALAAECLESVGIGALADRYPHQASLGQCQRASIARAVLTRPAILLADEPTGALDSKNAHDVVGLLLDIARGGASVLVVTHDTAVAERSDWQLRIQDGTIACI